MKLIVDLSQQLSAVGSINVYWAIPISYGQVYCFIHSYPYFLLFLCLFLSKEKLYLPSFFNIVYIYFKFTICLSSEIKGVYTIVKDNQKVKFLTDEQTVRNRPATTGFTFIFVCRNQELVHRQVKCEDTETPIFYMENPKWEKPRGSTNPEKTDHYSGEEIQIRNSEAATSSSPSFDRRVQSYTFTLSLTVTEETTSF